MEKMLIVKTNQGDLRGKLCADHYGKPYYSFQGIPYAQPPLGDLRFKAPKEPQPWSGIKDGTKEGNASYSRHMLFGNIIGKEDCLYLNVYTPKLSTESLKPVMFWIHGGAFVVGSGSTDIFGPDFLIHEDVVIVTINHRLGLLGFLSMNDPMLEVPGNAGLKDQVMALKWVKLNIKNFGGDPNNITIFGESVGGCSVHLLMLSPMSKGLFHKAIIQSGTSIGNRGRGQNSSPLLAKALKLSNATETEIFNTLKNMSTEEVFLLQEQIPELQGDNMFIRPVYNTARIHSATSKSPVYLYRMSIDSKLNLYKRVFKITDSGACHGDDVGYLFKNGLTPKILPGSIEENGMKVFTKFWTTFAKTGNPNPAEVDLLINVTWKPIEKDKTHFVDIGENVTVGINPEPTRMQFWQEIENMCSVSYT
ncbi:hypothetical protein FQR65_LT03966 [Abscondita terminalis]|nr:hypothetical protein FQR65_LT03966 [Abscondita terminalis]